LKNLHRQAPTAWVLRGPDRGRLWFFRLGNNKDVAWFPEPDAGRAGSAPFLAPGSRIGLTIVEVDRLGRPVHAPSAGRRGLSIQPFGRAQSAYSSRAAHDRDPHGPGGGAADREDRRARSKALPLQLERTPRSAVSSPEVRGRPTTRRTGGAAFDLRCLLLSVDYGACSGPQDWDSVFTRGGFSRVKTSRQRRGHVPKGGYHAIRFVFAKAAGWLKWAALASRKPLCSLCGRRVVGIAVAGGAVPSRLKTVNGDSGNAPVGHARSRHLSGLGQSGWPAGVHQRPRAWLGLASVRQARDTRREAADGGKTIVKTDGPALHLHARKRRSPSCKIGGGGWGGVVNPKKV